MPARFSTDQPRPMRPLPVRDFTSVSAIGAGRSATLASLSAGISGLTRCRFESAALDTFVGEVRGIDEERLPAALATFDCRNNRLAQRALYMDGFNDSVARARERYGAERIGVFIGTSTSGILQTENAFRHLDASTGALPAWFQYAETHNSFSVADFARRLLGLEGPAATVSAACASSAKVFASASRMIEAGLIDAAVVGGVDSLCLTTLYGFQSLQLTSARACRPFDVQRDGISIGEGAAFVLLERLPEHHDVELALCGVGESSDAYHMSAPHPDGLGAQLAMAAALRSAQLEPAAIDYVNLHGTGTQGNDLAEGKAVASVMPVGVRCSSTKAATGHALGAAGAVEAVVSLLALQSGVAPGGLNVSRTDPALRINYLLRSERAALRFVMSNSFGFGGANCSLIFGRMH